MKGLSGTYPSNEKYLSPYFRSQNAFASGDFAPSSICYIGTPESLDSIISETVSDKLKSILCIILYGKYKNK